jgi:hypothetical protein
MAKTYAGPAVLVGDGVEIPVEADLRVDFEWAESVNAGGVVVREPGLKSWRGSVVSGVEAFRAATLLDHSLTLRLPDGREGGVFVGCVTASSDVVDVVGSGPAPFWDEADEPMS